MSTLHPLLVLFVVAFALIRHETVLRAQADDAELAQIYSADQKDREGPVAATATLDWAAIGPRDAARRQRVRELIDAGRVRTGKDYERAALVFQHGDRSDDILLAHVLAVTALGKGNRETRWLAAASLDRFLQRVGQPQVFGTNFGMQAGQPWTLEPYNRMLIGPRLRDANCVPSQEDQARAVDALNKGQEPPSPAQPPCADSPTQ